MLKKSLESFLVAGLLTSSAVGETWNQFFDRFESSGSLKKEVISNYKNSDNKNRSEFDLHYFMRFKNSFKEDFNIDWGFGVSWEHRYMLNVPGATKQVGTFANAIRRLANTKCDNKSCLDYLDDKLGIEANNFPNSVVDGKKRIHFKNEEDKKKFLLHYFVGLGYHESGFYNHLISRDNAVGFFQMTTCTAKDLGYNVDEKNLSYRDKYNKKTGQWEKVCSYSSSMFGKTQNQVYDDRVNPKLNIDMGVKLNIGLLKKYGDMQYALSDHIGGPKGYKKYKKCVINKRGCNSKLVKEIRGLVNPVTKWKRRLDIAYKKR